MLTIFERRNSSVTNERLTVPRAHSYTDIHSAYGIRANEYFTFVICAFIIILIQNLYFIIIRNNKIQHRKHPMHQPTILLQLYAMADI